MKFRILAVFIPLLILISCAAPSNTALESPILLASFTENFVDVEISLKSGKNGEHFLSASFSPPDGYHLYSKDIPTTGVGGLGRPTLLELTEGSQLTVAGSLIESARAEKPDFEPRDLWVYPSGEVSLSLPVELPAGSKWVDDFVKVTYMACSESVCKPPVEGKVVSIRIPGADTVR
jgi:hypothetical protein